MSRQLRVLCTVVVVAACCLSFAGAQSTDLAEVRKDVDRRTKFEVSNAFEGLKICRSAQRLANETKRAFTLLLKDLDELKGVDKESEKYKKLLEQFDKSNLTISMVFEKGQKFCNPVLRRAKRVEKLYNVLSLKTSADELNEVAEKAKRIARRAVKLGLRARKISMKADNAYDDAYAEIEEIQGHPVE